MNYNLIYNTKNRIRLRFGKYAITKEQGFELKALLLELPGVKSVTTNHLNGGVLILHNDNTSKDDVFNKLDNLDITQLPGLPINLELDKIDSDFKKGLMKLCAWHFGSKGLLRLFAPLWVRWMHTAIKALPYIKDGLQCLLKRKVTVEVLDGTAIGASLLSGHHSTASSVMFLLSLSDLLMSYSNARAKNALISSLAINIDTVWVIRDDIEVSIPMSELAIGDQVKVRTGNMIPIDGTILSGDALINEAMMTGEPLPAHKTVAGTVFAGTVLEDGDITIKVTALANNSRVSKIIEMIESDEEHKASIQSNAERLADGIVPISFTLFFATLLFTRNISRALSVLMVDFSCAIKLTTPLVIITALKEASQNQILVKGGKYLETLSKVDTVVFDKTGTLTKATPEISKVISISDNYSEDNVLTIAACLEEHFPHSVASAIVSHAEKKGLHHPEEHAKVEYIVAHGIASSYDEHRAVIGSRHFVFEDEGIQIPKEKENQLNEKIGSDSAVYLAIDNELIGVICINDPPREDAKLAVELLRKEGINEIIMMTGDSESTAKSISEQLGLDKYYAAVLPDGKAKLIHQLKDEGKIVLMIGDGINDAPALSTANVSMSLKSSSDLAREVSDISIHSESLIKIIDAIKLSKALMKKISNNYQFIVGFNTGLIGFGVFGAISSGTSALLHNTSTLALAGLSARPLILGKDITDHETT